MFTDGIETNAECDPNVSIMSSSMATPRSSLGLRTSSISLADVHGIRPITKWTANRDYQHWVEAFARIPIQWPDPGMNKKREIHTVFILP